MQPSRNSTALAGLIASLAMYDSAMATTGIRRQITSDPNGHILTNLNVFSPDGEWIVYDERSDREGAKFDSASIKRVNVKSGAIESLYTARNGAFVGVVTYNPRKNSVVFIHGPENPTPDWSYAGHHREGSIVYTAKPGVAVNLDARDVTALFLPLEGTATRIPAPPKGAAQRRLTFTGDRKHPGIQGPRFWVRANASGDSLAFLMKDDAGNVQIYTVSPNGGAIRQMTKNAFSVGSTISWSPDGTRIAYAGDDSMFVTDVASGETSRVAPKDAARPVLALVADFSPSGRSIAYQRVVKTAAGEWNQIFVTDLSN